MKILLANPATRVPLGNGRERYYIKAGSRWPWSYTKKVAEKCIPPFPFFLSYAAAVLKEKGFDVQVIDGVALNMASTAFLARACAISPDLVVFETAMNAFGYDMDLARSLRAQLPETRLALAGPFATAHAETILRGHPFIDYVFLGEYELSLAGLAEKIRRGDEDLRQKGLALKVEEKIWVSRDKGYIEDLDSLPAPAFDLFPANDSPDMTCYGDGICTYRPAVTLHASRGCPFKCDFCLWNQVMYDNRGYRTFSPRRVVDEMQTVIRAYGAREIYFDDDDFCVRKKHVLAICAEIRDRGLDIKWSCMGDAMSTDEEMIRAMARAGCIFMKFGVESGDRNILKKIGKPLKPEKAIQVADWCRKHGIMTHATFVFGLYGDTMETMRKTLRLGNRIKFDYAQASIATPFPGTRLYEKLVADGAIDHMDYTKFDGTRSCVIETRDLSAAQVVAFRKKAILSMIFHKMLDGHWWRNYIRRNFILAREYGMGHVLAPVKALLRL